MRLDSNVDVEGKRVVHVRVDRIGATGDRELWWVALAFEDESTKPEGMFTNQALATELGESLAERHGVRVVVSNFT
jgi:hypothetical protein